MYKEKDLTKMAVYKFDNKNHLPNGIEVEIEVVSFNKDYSKLYFDENGDTYNDLKKPKGLRQGPRWVEDEINKIREKDNPDTIDIFKVLAWKLGKIDYKKSKETKKIEYVSNWVIKKSIQTSKYPISWDKYEAYSKEIINIWSDYRMNNINADTVWEKLVELATESHKDDMKGINTPTGTIIRGCGLPSKENKDELNCLLNSGKYVEYIQLLKSLCSKVYGKEDIWKDERYVDQYFR